eukprot:jgi/Tetstr1/458999/TSEL_004470.t1
MSSGSEFALKLHDSGGEESPSGKRQKQSPAQQSAPESTGSDFRVQLSSEDSEGQNEAQDKGVQAPGPEPAGAKAASQIANRAPDSADLVLYSSDRILRFLRRRLTSTESAGQGDRHKAYQMTMRPELSQISKQIEETITDVVNHGISTSILLIGDRGVGKTLALEQALSTAQGRFSEPGSERGVGIVRLNGLVTGGDRSVLEEIAMQMCKLFDLDFSSTAALEDNISFLKDSLQHLGGKKVVVFVLDEFDALIQRSKQQTTLYNLFDALQSPSVLACVIGVTTRHDTIGLLEKRVQSRFSHRKIVVPVPQALKSTEQSAPSSQSLTALTFLKEVLTHPSSKSDPNVRKFNESVARTLDSRPVQEALAPYTDDCCNLNWLCNIALLALSSVDRRKCIFQTSDIMGAVAATSAMEAGQEDLAPQLSVVQLYLLVAFSRVQRKGIKHCNFQTAYNEYRTLLITNAQTCETFSQSVCLRAFENLATTGMIGQNTSSRNLNSDILEYQSIRLLLSPLEVMSALKNHPNCPHILHQWVASEVVASVAVAE